MPFLLCEMTFCHINHTEKAYLSNPAQMPLSQSSQVGHCSSETAMLQSSAILELLLDHQFLSTFLCSPTQCSNKDSSPQTQINIKEAVSLMIILPVNIVCHRIYNQQVSMMMTSEHASRSSRGKGARRRWVCPVTTESLLHSINPALEIHCMKTQYCLYITAHRSSCLAEHIGSRTPMLQKHPRKHRILEDKDMCSLWNAVGLHKMKTFVTHRS